MIITMPEFRRLVRPRESRQTTARRLRQLADCYPGVIMDPMTQGSPIRINVDLLLEIMPSLTELLRPIAEEKEETY